MNTRHRTTNQDTGLRFDERTASVGRTVKASELKPWAEDLAAAIKEQWEQSDAKSTWPATRPTTVEPKVDEGEYAAFTVLSLHLTHGLDMTIALQGAAQNRPLFGDAWEVGMNPNELAAFAIDRIELV